VPPTLHTRRPGQEDGFTLIELLVVILIVGILAAIALPVFLHQQEKAQDAGAKADARNAVSLIESCFTTTQDYTACPNNESPLATGVVFSPVSAQGGYSVEQTSKSNTTFTISKSGSTITRTCAPVGNGCHTADADGNQW
jgi:type IV pilus assembly protein PilA